MGHVPKPLSCSFIKKLNLTTRAEWRRVKTSQDSCRMKFQKAKANFPIQNSEFAMEKSLCEFDEEAHSPSLTAKDGQSDNLGYLSKVRIIQSCR